MTFTYPWLAAGLSEVPLELPRVLAYVASGGRDGVSRKGDLRVKQSTVADGYVTVYPGAFATVSAFPSQAGQTYIGYNDSLVSVSIPANVTVSTVYYLVYAHVMDVGVAGQGTTPLPIDAKAVTCTSTTTTVQQVTGLETQTGYALARIAVPAGTSNITNAMITDLRSLIFPRRQELTYIVSLNSGTQALSSSGFTTWPNEANWSVDIPSWAVQAQVIGQIAGFRVQEAGSTGSNIVGAFQAKLGSYISADTIYNFSCPAGLGKVDAGGSMVAATWKIAQADRGTTVNLKLQGKKTTASPAGAGLEAGNGTTVAFQLVFVEDVDAT